MTFRELQDRLLGLLNQRVRSGQISQRQLARLTGFTQPHVHNVLKGARRCNTKLADAALRTLGLSVKDLLEAAPADPEVPMKVPIWRGMLGPNRSFPQKSDSVGYLLFSSFFLSRFNDPVLMRLAADEDAMSPIIEPGDLVLVDQTESYRRRPTFDHVYVVHLNGQGALCRCQQVGDALVLVSENNRSVAPLPGQIALRRHSMFDIVRGRVVWACREL